MNSHPLTFFKTYGKDPREQQIKVLNAVKSNWNNYKYFALSLPTGVGKTYIATSIASVLQNSYILTSTLQLQDQYIDSWPEIINLKGRGNYNCNLNTNFTVDAAPCAANKELYQMCKADGLCAYINQKNAAINSKSMITNPVYMLYSTHCGFAKEDESPWVKRSVLICDEAHNIENHLVSFAESDVDPEFYLNEFGVSTGVTFTGQVDVDYPNIVLILDALKSKAVEMNRKLEDEFPSGSTGNPREWAKKFNNKIAERVKKLNNRIYQLDKAIQPLKIFFNTHSTVEELKKRWLISKYPDKNVLKLAPIYGDFLFKEYFGKLADKFVFLSATLGSKMEFCKELGIDEDECFFIETDSPFDPIKSPILVQPSIKLSKDHYDQNVKKVGDLINVIMDCHETQRGLIHSVTYDIQKHIFNGVSKRNRDRLLCRDMDVLNNLGTNKFSKKYKNDELLAMHEISGKAIGSVLLSPSMMEGVDLPDDLCEFQVIIKLPWANLGDVRIKHKSNIDEDWYKNKMWLSILQASGRSTRHENDTSITYILDSNFKYFYSLWKSKLPDWFKKRLIF